MQYVYLLKADRKVDGGHLVKIGKTIRSPKKRLAEINRSWTSRGIQWRMVRVMSVFNCSAKEAALHREYKRYHVSSYEVSQAWGGVCDGDNELFVLPKADRKKLLHHMGAHSWSFDRTTWIAIGLGVGLLAGVWMWRSSDRVLEGRSATRILIK